MRRCPEEDDSEEPDRRQAQVIRDCSPTDEHWYSTSSAADYDILCRGALEAERVNEDVEENGGTGKHRAEQVDKGDENDESTYTQDDTKYQCLLGSTRPEGSDRR